MEIPYFLRPEYRRELTQEEKKLQEMRERYKEHFGVFPSTEPASHSGAEWMDIFRQCIEENIPIEELLVDEIETPDMVETEYIRIIQ